MTSAGTDSLDALRVLLVEDEFYIADDLRRALSSAGATVIGPCPDIASAEIAIAQGGFDVAILDLNLNGESAEPLAEQLKRRSIPFAIATGYGGSSVPPQLAGITRIEKPFEPSALIEVVKSLDPARTA